MFVYMWIQNLSKLQSRYRGNEMTKECIENFNTNFSKGKFEIFAGGMGYDEKEKNTNCYCCDVGNLYIYYGPNSLF